MRSKTWIEIGLLILVVPAAGFIAEKRDAAILAASSPVVSTDPVDLAQADARTIALYKGWTVVSGTYDATPVERVEVKITHPKCGLRTLTCFKGHAEFVYLSCLDQGDHVSFKYASEIQEPERPESIASYLVVTDGPHCMPSWF